jgi:glutathionyl-hydroquinone reductase
MYLAHRTLIFRALKGLEECISISVVHWLLTDKGWSFDMENCPGATGDTVENKKYLSELYLMANPNYSGILLRFCMGCLLKALSYLHVTACNCSQIYRSCVVGQEESDDCQ